MTSRPEPARMVAPELDQDSIREIPPSRMRALLRDFTALLGQQMYFWGRDVIHPSGNLLCKDGFERRKSEGLKGTSCYRKRLDRGGFIELHGACVGHYVPADETNSSFLYIRNRERCFLYSGSLPPAPGTYAAESLRTSPLPELYFASLRFLNWWLDYEEWISKQAALHWRDKNYAAFSSLPASRPSLRPAEAIQWLSEYRSNPAKITRIRDRMRSREA